MNRAILLFALLLSIAAAAQAPPPLLLPESALPPHKFIPVFGQKIADYDIGTGPVLVLVHGFGSQARFDWGNVLAQLAQHHRVIALDQIGFGASAKPQFDYSVQTYVDFLGEFLRDLHIQKFNLAGESLGGWISALYTIESLDSKNTGTFALPAPQRLILEDAAGMMPLGQSATPIPIAGTLADARSVAIVFHDKSRVTDQLVRDTWEMKMKANDGFTDRSLWANLATSRESVGDRLTAITIPTLVIWGGSDEIIPIAQGRAYTAGIPGAKLAIVPECGHSPGTEKPKDFLAAALPFIDAK